MPSYTDQSKRGLMFVETFGVDNQQQEEYAKQLKELSGEYKEIADRFRLAFASIVYSRKTNNKYCYCRALYEFHKNLLKIVLNSNNIYAALTDQMYHSVQNMNYMKQGIKEFITVFIENNEHMSEDNCIKTLQQCLHDARAIVVQGDQCAMLRGYLDDWNDELDYSIDELVKGLKNDQDAVTLDQWSDLDKKTYKRLLDIGIFIERMKSWCTTTESMIRECISDAQNRVKDEVALNKCRTAINKAWSSYTHTVNICKVSVYMYGLMFNHYEKVLNDQVNNLIDKFVGENLDLAVSLSNIYNEKDELDRLYAKIENYENLLDRITTIQETCVHYGFDESCEALIGSELSEFINQHPSCESISLLAGILIAAAVAALLALITWIIYKLLKNKDKTADIEKKLDKLEEAAKK